MQETSETPYRLNKTQWLLLGLLMRLLVMPFTTHGDFFFIYKTPSLFSHGDWNAYQNGYAGYYPPLTLLWFSGTQLLTRLFFPALDDFIQGTFTGDFSGTGNNTFNPTYVFFENEHLFQSLFLMKTPYLIFDFCLVALFWKMLPDENDQTSFTIFWSFNPVVIYGAYMAGQLSLAPAALVAASCYFCLQPGKERFACLALGCGFLFKIFPIIFLPMVLCVVSRTWKEILIYSLWAIVPIVVLYGGFYIVSGPAVFKVFLAGGMSVASSFKPDLGILVLRAMQAGIYLFVCWRIFSRYGGEMNYSLLLKYFLVVYIALMWGAWLSSTHYMIWFMPFLIAFIIRRREWKIPFYGLLTVLFLAGLKSRYSCFGIFRPLEPEMFMSLPSMMDVAGFLFPLNAYYTFLGLVFKLTTGCIAFLALKNQTPRRMEGVHGES